MRRQIDVFDEMVDESVFWRRNEDKEKEGKEK
jgi:hypothetical protein